MPPKPAVAVKGQQSSLFSFFKKATPVPLSQEESITITPEVSNDKLQIDNSQVHEITQDCSTQPQYKLTLVQVEDVSLPFKDTPQEKSTSHIVSQTKAFNSDEIKDSPSDGPKKRAPISSSTKRLSKKSKSIVLSDNDEWSDDDNESDFVDEASRGSAEDNDSFIADESDDERPKKLIKRLPTKSEKKSSGKILSLTPAIKSNTKAVVTASSKSEEAVEISQGDVNELPEGVYGRGNHEHDTIHFLQPSNIRDKNHKRPSDIDYNPKTFYISDQDLKEETPAMSQWWKFKSENMDTVLFFKVGKFYELFHMDADIGVAELDLIYMKGKKAHSGFPEVSYGKYANLLVSKGYRVARVEQTETPEMLKERNSLSGKKNDKVVRRELCSIMSKGTRTYCHLDDLALIENDLPASQSILLCIQKRITESENVEFGVCMIDTVLSNVMVGQFEDDDQRSRLRTFVSQFPPSEVILKKVISTNETDIDHNADVLSVIRSISPGAVITYLYGSEMPSVQETINLISQGNYFHVTNSCEPDYPEVLRQSIEGSHCGDSDLLTQAYGASLLYLRRSLIDYEIISLRKMIPYIPPDIDPSSIHQNIDIIGNHNTISSAASSFDSSPVIRSMTIDAIALSNLEVLVNNYDNSEKGSLWAFINHCKTAFGKRQLREWLCHPLFQVEDILYRSKAVDELLMNNEVSGNINELRLILKNIPDLERLLSRVHSNGLKHRSPLINKDDIGINNIAGSHPDSRAVMYEMNIYTSKKIAMFSDILSGFEFLVKIGKLFESCQATISSSLLQKIISDPSSNKLGRFPYVEMAKQLQYFRTIFNEKQAKKDGYIIPNKGINQEYDKAKELQLSIESEFEKYLRDCMNQTGIKDIKYFGSNRDRYQLEIPMSMCSKVPSDWITKSQKKTHRRYWTKWIENKLNLLQQTEERVKVAQNDTLRAIFEKFDEKYHLWIDAVNCVAILDALLSLAAVSSNTNYNWPTLLKREDDPGRGTVFEVENGRHPMLEHAMSQRGDGDYIPNSLSLGLAQVDSSTPNPKLLLLTGPNMGGKSTLLRQTCLIAILAQIGCKVPADSCHMTCVDRIFTRLGACDHILAGQSTFYVELAEASMILKYATSDSLCILDELGRGTATFDGTAIAHSVLQYLLSKNQSRVLFATHYHSLIEDWDMDPRVQLGHMECIVDVDENNNQDNSQVTFLYKLSSGSSPQSYGINVAKLAKLPIQVLEIAMKQSLAFESRMKLQNDQMEQQVLKFQYHKRLQQYFEKLVSVIHSNMTNDEIVNHTKLLWEKFHLEKLEMEINI